MSLEEIQKELYKEEGDIHSAVPEQITGQAGPIKSENWQGEEEKKPVFSLNEKSRQLIRFIGIGLGILAILLAGFFVWRHFFYFNSSKISLDIYAPERLVSGEEINYVVNYKNNTRMELKEARLLFFFPDHSIINDGQETSLVEGREAGVYNIGAIKPGGEERIEFKSNVIGLKNEKKTAQAKLVYKTGSNSSVFENMAEFESEIILVPIVLNFEMPEKTVSGQQLDFFLKYLNTSDTSFHDVILQIDLPDGFDVSSVSPAASDGQNRWLLSEIGSKEEGKISFSGKLNGSQDEIKTFQAAAGFEEDEIFRPVSEGIASTMISAAPLSIELLLDEEKEGIISAGQTLSYIIKYKNTVNLPISSVYVTAKLDSRILDFSSLKAERGFFNNFDNTITWNESSFPDFKMVDPGKEGTLRFTIRVKERLPVNNFSDKNFTAKVRVSASSSNVPISLRGTQLGGVDEIEAKMRSKVVLAAKAFYYDSLMENSGPLPPRVGQQTTYSVYWQVINIGNDLENVIIESYLPPNIKWLGNFQPSGADISYNQSSGKIVWRIGNLAANTGILTPVKQAVFQVGLIPASNQVGEMVEIIKESQLSARDLFTQEEARAADVAIDSTLPDDSSVGDMGRVSN